MRYSPEALVQGDFLDVKPLELLSITQAEKRVQNRNCGSFCPGSLALALHVWATSVLWRVLTIGCKADCSLTVCHRAQRMPSVSG